VEFYYLFFDGVPGHQPVDGHGVLLTDAVSAVRGLILDSRIPPGVHVDDVIGGSEVEPQSSGFETDEKKVPVPRLKGFHLFSAHFGQRASIQVTIANASVIQIFANEFQLADELTENQCFVTSFQ